MSLGSLDGSVRGVTLGFGLASVIDDCISVIKLSILDVSDGLFPDREFKDRDGLVLELA